MKKSDFLQILKFGLVGVCNTALDYGLFYVFLSLLHFDKNVAQILATALAMVNSYLVNRYWTFNKTGTVQGREIWKFIGVNLLSLLTTLACLNLFHDVMALYIPANRVLSALGLNYQLSDKAAVMFCKLLAMPFSLAVNFLGNRLWVFRSTDEEKTVKKG